MLVNVVDPRALRSVREHCTLAAKGRKVQSYSEMGFGPSKMGRERASKVENDSSKRIGFVVSRTPYFP